MRKVRYFSKFEVNILNAIVSGFGRGKTEEEQIKGAIFDHMSERHNMLFSKIDVTYLEDVSPSVRRDLASKALREISTFHDFKNAYLFFLKETVSKFFFSEMDSESMEILAADYAAAQASALGSAGRRQSRGGL